MIKNVQALKDKVKKIAKENNLTIQQVLQNYMFERFLYYRNYLHFVE